MVLIKLVFHFDQDEIIYIDSSIYCVRSYLPKQVYLIKLFLSFLFNSQPLRE